jgi:hypothetical protein
VNRRLVATALLSLGLLTACATPTSTATRYVKPGAETAARHQDEIACLRTASESNDEGYLLLPFQIDRAAFHRCMRGRGYTATADSAGPATR